MLKLFCNFQRKSILFAQTFRGGTKTNIIFASLPRSIAVSSPSQSPTEPNTLLSSFLDVTMPPLPQHRRRHKPQGCFLLPPARPPENVKTLEPRWRGNVAKERMQREGVNRFQLPKRLRDVPMGWRAEVRERQAGWWVPPGVTVTVTSRREEEQSPCPASPRTSPPIAHTGLLHRCDTHTHSGRGNPGRNRSLFRPDAAC